MSFVLFWLSLSARNDTWLFQSRTTMTPIPCLYLFYRTARPTFPPWRDRVKGATVSLFERFLFLYFLALFLHFITLLHPRQQGYLAADRTAGHILYHSIAAAVHAHTHTHPNISLLLAASYFMDFYSCREMFRSAILKHWAGEHLSIISWAAEAVILPNGSIMMKIII